MLKALYAAESGMLSRNREIDTISNNIANAKTAGFKKEMVITSSFGEGTTFRVGRRNSTAEIGSTLSGALVSDVTTFYEQGPLEQTNRPLDLAIEGDGFFTLQQQNGTTKLTRNGSFTIREDGYLTDLSGSTVMGENGAIYVGNADFIVSGAGMVSVNGVPVDTLKMTRPVSMDGAVKQEDASFIFPAGAEQQLFEGTIKQGFLEMSNTDMVSEMSDLIESSRAFQSCSQIIKMMDKIIEKSVNEIANM